MAKKPAPEAAPPAFSEPPPAPGAWLFKAIEDAALNRARVELALNPNLRVFGMSVGQIGALRRRFHAQTGFAPEDIAPDQILVQPIVPPEPAPDAGNNGPAGEPPPE